MARWAGLALASAVAFALGLATSGAHAQGICDPLVVENCVYPFPNNFYTKPDSTTPTGLRVVFPDEAVPKDRSGAGFSMAAWSRLDGFSTSTVAMTYLANASVELTPGLPGWQDVAVSLRAESPTVLLDAQTGELLPHFAELDYTSGPDAMKAFMIWPVKQLKFANRYIVAIRNVRNTQNTVISPSEAFRAFRDDIPTSDPDIENRRTVYANIFSTLAAAGVSRNNLQIAWEFTTGSLEYTTGWLTTMRDDATSRLPAGGPSYRIVNVQDEVSSSVYRLIEGEMTVPHYMTNNARPGSTLVIDANNRPVYQGTVEVPFNVYIPRKCVQAGAAPCPIMNYGHGLLGSRTQTGGQPSDVGNREGYIMVGVDMWGMSSFDVPYIVLAMLNDLADVVTLPDRSHQGILNHLLVTKLMRGSFANDTNVIFNGQSVVNPSISNYWGISQGGILGSVVVAVSQDVDRGHLGVPVVRLRFKNTSAVIKGRYTNALDRIILLSFIGLLWDRAEPAGYMSSLSNEFRLPGITRDKQVYMDYANGDAQVSYLGAYFMARSAGAKIFTNNVICQNETSPVYGIAVSPSPSTGGSIMVGFDFDVSCGPIVNTPPAKETAIARSSLPPRLGFPDTHGSPRRDVRNQDMAAEFFRTGRVTDRCNGAGCYKPSL